MEYNICFCTQRRLHKQTIHGKLLLKQLTIAEQIKTFPACMRIEDEIYVCQCHHAVQS
jgi:hypothetical protein